MSPTQPFRAARPSGRQSITSIATNTEEGTYRSAFTNWDRRATVRVGPRRVLCDDEPSDWYFSPELFPVVAHRLIAERGVEVTKRLLVQRLYQYLQFTVELELVAVVPVVGQIARGKSGLTVPARMRLDALKIATDEAWHAQFSYDLIDQVQAATGVVPRLPGTPSMLSRLAEIRRDLGPDAVRAHQLVFAVVSETLISSILSCLPGDHRLPRAVRDTVRDHAEDEGRHHAYFRDLLRFLWPQLSPRQRNDLGVRIPDMIFAFLEPDFPAVKSALLDAGIAAEMVPSVISDSYPRETVLNGIRGAAKTTIRYFANVGTLDEPAVQDAFKEVGLLDS